MEDPATSLNENNIGFEDLLKLTQRTLEDLITNSEIINDLPKDVTLEELKAQLALAHGQSITVYLLREDGEKCPIVVPQNNSTVLDLKNSIKRYMNLRLTREGVKRKISWRYVWRNNWLSFEGKKLTKDWVELNKYGIRNKSTVSFTKRFRDKNKMNY